MSSLDRRSGGAQPGGTGGASERAGVPGKRTLTEQLQLKSRGALDSGVDVQSAASDGVAGGGGSLPFLDQIQASFGRHDVSAVQAHVGGNATAAAQTIGAEAYATGNHVAFGGTPTLETTAHEAAHVVQQRSGVQLKGGVGEAGDPYEQHADAVASLVVQGKSAEGLLDQMSGGGGSGAAPVQRKLNMTAGYTEALNWSSEAQALIKAYDELVEVVEALEALRPQLTGRPWRNRRTQINGLRTFLTNLERQRIPNDKAVREQHTANIEAQKTRADDMLEQIHARLGTSAPKKDDDELEGPEAENEVVDATTHEHDFLAPPTPTGEAAPAKTAEKTPTPPPPVAAGNSTAGNSTATPTPPKTPTPPTPVLAGNSSAGNSTASATPPKGPAPEHEAAPAEGEEADGSPVVEAIQAIEVKIFEMDKRKAEASGRAGSASAELGGGVKASGAEGAQGELKAEIKLMMGKSGEKTSAPLNLLAIAHGEKVQMRTKGEAMVGAKLGASVEGGASVSREGVSGALKGSASAFLGGSVEIAPQIRFVDASGKPLAAVTGIGGVSYGIGGSYEGSIAFEGWSLKFSSKGKMSAGLGVSWGMSGEIDAAALYHAIFG
jgi:hypothetical protein